jgi:hypothetical protein
MILLSLELPIYSCTSFNYAVGGRMLMWMDSFHSSKTTNNPKLGQIAIRRREPRQEAKKIFPS